MSRQAFMGKTQRVFTRETTGRVRGILEKHKTTFNGRIRMKRAIKSEKAVYTDYFVFG